MKKEEIIKFFKLAKNASTFSDFPRVRHGAVIIYKGRVLSVGWNTTKTMPLQMEYNKYRNFNPEFSVNSAHAEIMALDRAMKQYENIDFSKCSIFCYREYQHGGGLAPSKPCPACEAAIRNAGIQNVFYTMKGSFVHETYLKNNSMESIQETILKEE